MNRLAQEAAIEHVGVGCDDLKDKNQCENELARSRSEKARQQIPAGSIWKPWLEVTIVPNISGGDAYASLAELRLA